MVSGRRLQRPSSPMSTDSNMSPAITHRRPRRHKQNQTGEQDYQPRDVFNDGKEINDNERYYLCLLLMSLMNLLNVTSVPTDACMPLSFSGHLPHADYKVRGATLPRMGSGENRGRRGSTGTHRIKEAACEQRENPDKHKTPPGGKGSSKSRQHSGTRWILFHIQYFMLIIEC